MDTETTGLAFYDVPFLATFWWEDRGFAVDLGSKAGRCACAEVLSGTPTLLFHNAKFDLQKLELVHLYDRSRRQQIPGDGLVLEAAEADAVRDPRPGVHDTEALAHLLDEHRPKGLKPLARSVLGLDTDEAKAIQAARRKAKLTKADGLDKLYEADPDLVITYAIKDVEFTWKLFHHLWPLLAKHDDLVNLYELERELMWVLLDMEWAGMGLDLDYTQTKAKEYAGKTVKAEWAIGDATGLDVWYPDKPGRKTPEGKFNPNSNDQIHAYFAGKGIHEAKYDKHVLKTLEDPLAPALLDLRGANKMGNYLKAMLVEQRDGVLHPNFRQHGTRGRRMSSGEAED